MAQVTGVEAALYGIPPEEPLEDATQSLDELELVVVEVETDAGDGLGFTYTIGEGGTAVREFVGSVLAPKLVGTDAAPRPARRRLRGATTFVGREGVSELALSAVDIALWDALGRRLNAPLYELLGGERRRVAAYRTDGGWLQCDRATLVENARRAAREGFAGFKMKVGAGHAADAGRVRAVREALPADVDLMVDANCAWTVPEARRFARRLEVPLAWLEEPLPKGDTAAYADLRERIDLPVAAGENFYDPTQCKQAMAAGAVDVLQPDVCRVGGVSAWTAVARAAETWGLPVAPHYVEPIHVHLACAVGTVDYVERHSTVLDGVLESPPTVEDGCFRPPDAPGHGVRFDGLAAYRK